MPPSRPITSDDLNYNSIDEAIDDGGEFGFITFSTNNKNALGVVTSLSLYTISSDDSYSEVPIPAGGQIVPIIFCYGYVDETEIFELIGGFDHTVLDWSVR